MERFDLVMSDDGRPYGITRNGPNIALPLRGSRGLRTRLAAIFADATRGTAPSQSSLADALAVLEGYAARKDPVSVHLRLARHGDGIVIDLGTADGRCLIVGPGGWRVEGRSPVLFRRTALTSVIPDPVRDGDGLAALSSLLNADEAAFRLLAGWMVSSLIPDTRTRSWRSKASKARGRPRPPAASSRSSTRHPRRCARPRGTSSSGSWWPQRRGRFAWTT